MFLFKRSVFLFLGERLLLGDSLLSEKEGGGSIRCSQYRRVWVNCWKGGKKGRRNVLQVVLTEGLGND